ncbi:type II secretion system protein M [Alteromonas sp. C1M14]|uniref:type II secretion system protein M n=1 Tax=Alteromonas sp. C1M14 TaxID=2841567 RepID=UPI001C089416|nr:type II secretion system protein M [Alteromonas sp. C1M14]MBU2978324.1 type II secretion system protein M [Alteromonas sp. C1M14]
MKKIIEKYKELSEREQRLTLISGVVIIIALFYWVIWQPLTVGVAQQTARLESQQALLTWVNEQSNRAQQLRRSSGKTPFNGSLAQGVNNAAERFNIAIARMQPQDDELQVTVDEAPFNLVLDWLQAMEAMGIRIIQADFAEGDDPGMIKIRRLQLGK